MIDMEEFTKREEARKQAFNDGMAAVRARTSPVTGTEIIQQSDTTRRENLSELSHDDLVELALKPCERCKQRRHDLFKLSDHLSDKLVWEITLDDFAAPFVPTDEFLEGVDEGLHDALAMALDAHGYDHSELRYVIQVE